MFNSHVERLFEYGLNTSIQSFDFYSLPLSTNSSVFVSVSFYLGTILVIKTIHSYLNLGRSLQPLLKLPFFVHNVFLSLFSLGLLLCYLEIVVPLLIRRGLFFAMCHVDAYTKPLQALYYLNYLTKLLEWMDTVYLILNGSRLNFLHWYHHAATMVLCFTQLDGASSCQWIVISINLFVHFIMYGYYALSTIGIHVWWKKYITSLQISQFVIDLVAVFYGTYYATFHYWRYMFPTSVVADFLLIPNVLTRTCAGTPLAAIAGSAILSSYLFLFIKFYLDTYKRSPAKDIAKLKSQ